jgi:hypothetical protein
MRTAMLGNMYQPKPWISPGQRSSTIMGKNADRRRRYSFLTIFLRMLCVWGDDLPRWMRKASESRRAADVQDTKDVNP